MNLFTGLQYELEIPEDNPHIQFESRNRSVKYTTYEEPAILFGTYQFKCGTVHFWKLHVSELLDDSYISKLL